MRECFYLTHLDIWTRGHAAKIFRYHDKLQTICDNFGENSSSNSVDLDRF